MAKAPSLDEILSSEIKQDIAGRYFGFRKLIEEDKLDLAEKIKQHSFILEKRISFDLIRIYILLRDEALIQAFLELAGLNEKLFYDPYLTESPSIIKRVFECQRFRGLTRRSRFRNYILDCYANLVHHVELYDRKIKELEEARGSIAAEIELFYRENDISAILGFLRSLGNTETSGSMAGGMEPGLAEGLDKKLRIEPPLPIEQLLPVVPPLTPLPKISRRVKQLINRAYAGQSPELLAMFAEKRTPCDQRDS